MDRSSEPASSAVTGEERPAPVRDVGDRDSANLSKYTSGGAFYRWQLGRFMHRLYEMVARTGPQSVLDAGCGEGFTTRFLRRQNADWALTGVDVRAGAIRYARRQPGRGLTYAVGDLYDLPFDEDAFDTVLCSEVLEHLGRPGEALDELCRVARRAVVLSVPREPYFRGLVAMGRAMGRSPDPGHVNFWNERGFRRFVRSRLRHPHFATKHIYQLARGYVS